MGMPILEYSYQKLTFKIPMLSASCMVAAASFANMQRIENQTPASRDCFLSWSDILPVPPLHGDRSIIRQNSLARSSELFVACHGGKAYTMDDTTCDLVIRFARKFEAYSAGDLDLEAAKSDIKEESK